MLSYVSGCFVKASASIGMSLCFAIDPRSQGFYRKLAHDNELKYKYKVTLGMKHCMYVCMYVRASFPCTMNMFVVSRLPKSWNTIRHTYWKFNALRRSQLTYAASPPGLEPGTYGSGTDGLIYWAKHLHSCFILRQRCEVVWRGREHEAGAKFDLWVSSNPQPSAAAVTCALRV